MSNDVVNASDDDDSQSDSKMNKTLLSSLHRRRMSCTLIVQQLWDAVKVSRYQRQIAGNDRILKYMSRVHNVVSEEVNRQVGYSLRDGLLLIQKKKTSKGSKQGTEQEGYKLPEQAERDKHDWYCFECHRGGDVIFCSNCHRVYHLSCINNLPNSRSRYLCPVCTMCDKPELLDVRIKRLNRLISMTCSLLRDKYVCLNSSSEMLKRPITIGNVGSQLDIGDEGWRIEFLIHRGMDISRMASKAKERVYSHLGQFIADARTIVHNVVIFHGVHSRMADDARRMLRDCQTEIQEIKTCHQCYYSYRSKTSRHWFCRPCVPPHNLVYAKTPTTSYCPAKVLLVDGSKYEVRFFGGNHERARVEIGNCLPITANTNHFEVIRTPIWTKACEELKRHQDLLDKGPPSDSSSSSDDDDDSVSRAKRLKGVLSPDIKSDESLAGDEDTNTEVSKQPSEEAVKEEEEEEWDEDDEPLEVRLRGSRLSRSSSTTGSGNATPTKRKRGRPPKSKSSQESIPTPQPRARAQAKPRSTATPRLAPSTTKRRGRPRGSLNKKTLLAKTKSKEEVKKDDDEDEEDQDNSNSDNKEKDKDNDDDKDNNDKEDNDYKSANDNENDSDNDNENDNDEQEDDEETERKEDDDDEDKERVSDDVMEEQEEQTEVKKEELLKPESPTSSSKSFDPKNEEGIVSSSCTEPQFRSVAVQTKHNLQKLEVELEELKSSHAEQIKQLQAAHLAEITVTKKKQWCYNCEQEAIYHCCWNTAYCSTECQQIHWQREHKRVCRRKR